jgi:hypothetical protein
LQVTLSARHDILAGVPSASCSEWIQARAPAPEHLFFHQFVLVFLITDSPSATTKLRCCTRQGSCIHVALSERQPVSALSSRAVYKTYWGASDNSLLISTRARPP